MMYQHRDQLPHPPRPRVLVAHLGARMHYAVPVLLHRSGYLDQMFTDAYVGEGSWLSSIMRCLPQSVLSGSLGRLAQRKAHLPPDMITAFNLLGLRYALALRKSPSHKTYITDIYLKFGLIFLKKILSTKSLDRASMVYGFTRGSLELFQAAKQLGRLCVVEQMIAPLQELAHILEQEHKLWPGWQKQGVIAWDKPLWIAREAAEWRLADRIIAPSEYVKSTLISAGIPAEKIVAMPYSVSLDTFKGRIHSYDGHRRLRVLFVGSVVLRKGIPYLLQALELLGSQLVEARIVGSIAIEPEKLNAYKDVVQFTGGVSRQDVLAHYNWADIFVFPSLCEGSATVTYEARACGLPVIATPNAGAWIRDGEDGIIVPIRDVQELVNALKRFIDHPALVQQMSRAALDRAPQFSWDAYDQRLNSLVLSLHRENRDTLYHPL